MNRERIAKMTDKVVEVVTAEEVDNTRIAAVEGEDDAFAMVDQAVDAALSSLIIIDENLPKIKTDSIPQKAAIDAIKDIMDSALKPYLADVIVALKVFEG